KRTCGGTAAKPRSAARSSLRLRSAPSWTSCRSCGCVPTTFLLASSPGLTHERPARFVLEEAHGIDSTRFQLVANHLNRGRIKAVRSQTIVFHDVLKPIPWFVVDRAVEETGADGDARCIKTRPLLIAMLHAQFTGARGLREVETNLKSHASKLPQLGGCTISKSALSDANAHRPCEIFARLLSALML